MRDEAAGGCEPYLPGEEVVMMSRGDGPAGRGARASRPELERARREKRKVGEEEVDMRDTAREKRVRQTTIDEMYVKEKLAEFTDAWLQWTWLQWIYAKGLSFNAFRGPKFQRVRQAAKRVLRNVRFLFPSYRVTAGVGIPSQRGKVATMVSEVRSAFQHTGATILSDGRKSRSGKPFVNFLAGGANGALLYATVARDGSVPDTADVVYRRWRAIVLSFPAKDVIGFCMDSASNYTTAARRFATELDADIRRIIWLPCSTHLCNLMLSDVGTRVGRQTVQDSPRPDQAFPLAAGRLGRSQLSDAEADDCRGDRETERCAQWWFDHGRRHPELCTIAIRVMHLWTSASPAERNWAQHECINTVRRHKLGFAKLAQLVEIATNLKLASCAQQGSGYVLPWVMGTGQEETAGRQEDDEGDVDPEVWGARPASSFSEQDIERQVVAFHSCRPSRADPFQDVFGKRATELRPWPEQTPDADADDDTSDD
ncbi:hypothetical protein CBR_g20218 [Chara braunii]|uniref:DUF659 domain-containing protein n=1 Tax=Chara braunii TaxID=69332 RepID=A0A388KZU9_CHABU|nr:hypothetical protein CBR_g20218 [Chara braunii]|eukprot:GBG75587.1 hypothetical protein CBR_g20218 [Chara braunii]